MRDKRAWFTILIALAIRAVYVSELWNEPFFASAIGDGELYDSMGLSIARGDWWGGKVFSMAPLYPYFLGVLYKLLGHDPKWVIVIQVILSSLACGFISRVGSLWWGRRVGLVSGLLMAIYPTSIFYTAILEKVSLGELLFASHLFFLVRGLKENKGWGWAGATLSLMVLVRENAIILLFAESVWIFLFSAYEWKVRLVRISALILGFVIVLLPVRLRDRHFSGELRMTSVQLGFNFYIGNNASADGTYKPLKENRGDIKFEWEDGVDIASAEAGRKLNPSEVSQHFLKKGLDYAWNNPLAWLKLTVQKWLLTWNNIELGDTLGESGLAEFSIILKLAKMISPFGFVFSMALCGFVIGAARKEPMMGIWFLIFLSLTAAVSLFFVLSRYRFPLVSLLIPLAALGLTQGVSFLQQRHWRGILRFGILFLLGLGLTHLSVVPPSGSEAIQKATTFVNFGMYLEAVNKPHEAHKLYKRAVTLNARLYKQLIPFFERYQRNS